MIAFLRLLTPRAWFVGGLALLLVFVGVQTWRINHAKHDLKEARAALVNPKTKRTWEQDFTASQRNLDICHGSVLAVQTSLDTQNAAIAANAADGARRAKMLSDGLQQARKAAAAADKRSLDILAVKPKGADQCARLMDLDRQINGGR